MSALPARRLVAPALRLHAPPLCPECGRRVRQPDRRGLCAPCWRDPALRAKHPAARRGNRFEHPDTRGRRPQPPRPTDAAPGSAEKVMVLRERARLYLSLHHVRDRRGGSGGLGEIQNSPELA